MATYTISGGETSGYTVTSGQSLEVQSGGTSSASVIDFGGSEAVDAGGASVDDAVNGSQTVSGTATSAVVGSGGEQDVYGAASGTVVMEGGTEAVEVGATDLYAVLSGGTQTVSGTATGVLVVSGGEQDVYGTATSTTLNYGTQNVLSGGTAVGTVLKGGQFISSGGAAVGTTIIDGGQTVSSGGTATGTTVLGGSQGVDGVATDTVVSAGNQTIFGFASGTRLYDSTQYVEGAAVDTTVGAGSYQTVERGGAATDTTVEAQGYQFVTLSSTATDTMLDGGEQVVLGAASATTIGDGGLEYVQSGGSISGSVIAGGTLVLSAGAITEGPITFSGAGTLDIAAPVGRSTSSTFGAEIDGLAAGNTIDLAGFAYASGATSATLSNSVLTVTNGSSTETFALGGPSVHYVSATADAGGGILLTAGAAPAISGLAASTPASGTAPVMPFAGAAITDLNDGGSDIDTLTIVQSGGGALSSGETLLSGNAGDGTTTYVLSGTAADLTAELRALSFIPAPGTPNTSAVTTFALTATSPADARPATGSTSVIDATPPVAPTVVGGGATTTAQNLNVRPFTSASVDDPNANSSDTLSIQVNGGGVLTGSGLGGGAGGLYTLSGAAQQVTANLQRLIYTPAANPPGSTTVTTFTLTDVTGAGTSASDASTSVTDTVVPAPATGTTPSVTPDAVSLSSDVRFVRGTFTLTGTVSSAATVASVEVSAIVDGRSEDLGTATVNTDNSFTFADRVGGHLQGFITATVTDGSGGTAAAVANYSLQGGLHQGAYTGRQVLYTADGIDVGVVNLFSPGGSQKANVKAPGQTLASSYADVFDNGGQPDTTFVFDPGHGTAVVNLFRAGGADHDTLSFKDSDYGGSIADVLRHTTRNGAGDAVIHDPATGDAVRLTGITKQQLVANPDDITLHT